MSRAPQGIRRLCGIGERLVHADSPANPDPWESRGTLSPRDRVRQSTFSLYSRAATEHRDLAHAPGGWCTQC